MHPLLINTFFREGSGASLEASGLIGGFVNIRILGSEKTRDFLPVGEDFIAELEGLRDADGDYANDADLTVTVEDLEGTELISPQAMEYVTGSHGTYRHTFSDSLPLVAATQYRVVIAGDTERDRVMWAE